MIVRLVTKGDAFALELLQPLAVDVDTANRWHSGGVIPKDVAHVVEQPCGRQYDRRRTLLSALNSIHEHFCIGMSAVICSSRS